MRPCNSRYRLLLAAILLASLIPSCKSPTSPVAASSPTLTLSVPDSAGFDEQVSMSVTSSEALQPNWVFMWNFGDSTSETTTAVRESHTYFESGAYKVVVEVEDTVLHQAVAQVSSSIKIDSGPAITLFVPDSVSYGDACNVRATSSVWQTPGWAFQWDWGDGSTTFSHDSAFHVYLKPGIYNVRVSLMDTIARHTLASSLTKVLIFASHFDPSLLHSMQHVKVEFLGKFVVATSGSRPPFVDTGILLYSGSPVWTRDTFGQNLTNSSSDTSTGMYGLQINQGSENGGAGGYVNPNNPATVNYSEELSSDWSTVYPNDVGENTYSTYTKQMGFIDLPFKSQNDPEIVFGATGPLLEQPGFSEHQSFDGRAAGSGTTDISIDWTNAAMVPKVTITFSR